VSLLCLLTTVVHRRDSGPKVWKPKANGQLPARTCFFGSGPRWIQKPGNWPILGQKPTRPQQDFEVLLVVRRETGSFLNRPKISHQKIHALKSILARSSERPLGRSPYLTVNLRPLGRETSGWQAFDFEIKVIPQRVPVKFASGPKRADTSPGPPFSFGVGF